MSVMTVLKSW